MEIKITRSPRGRPYALIVFLTIIAIVIAQGVAGFAATGNAKTASTSAASSDSNTSILPSTGHDGVPLPVMLPQATPAPVIGRDPQATSTTESTQLADVKPATGRVPKPPIPARTVAPTEEPATLTPVPTESGISPLPHGSRQIRPFTCITSAGTAAMTQSGILSLPSYAMLRVRQLQSRLAGIIARKRPFRSMASPVVPHTTGPPTTSRHT